MLLQRALYSRRFRAARNIFSGHMGHILSIPFGFRMVWARMWNNELVFLRREYVVVQVMSCNNFNPSKKKFRAVSCCFANHHRHSWHINF